MVYLKESDLQKFDSKLAQSQIRIFLSYSSEDKIIAGKIKEILEGYGFVVFLAHEDLEPMVAFQDEIVNNLRS